MSALFGPSPLSRREFLQHSALATATLLAPAGLRAAAAPSRPAASAASIGSRKLFSAVGITAPVSRAAELKELGADFIVESVARFLLPDRSDAEFEPNRKLAAASVLPVLGCNSFLRDASLRCTGPEANHARVLAFAETTFRRLHDVGAEFVVFGSNTARQVPAGFPMDKANEQFIALLRAMGPLAERYKILVAVEPQRAVECNFINHIAEAVAVVAPVNHPNIRVLADLYHMAVMGDTPADLTRAMPWVGWVELAEKENRTIPGVAGDDFRPYFTALAAGGYKGRMDIEASGTPAQMKTAFETLSRQAADAVAAARG